MAQLFGRRTSIVFRLAVLGLPVLAAGLLVASGIYLRSNAAWGVGQSAIQPIPFQHDLHVASLGLDCRFCHGAVEKAAFGRHALGPDLPLLPFSSLGEARHARAPANQHRA